MAVMWELTGPNGTLLHLQMLEFSLTADAAGVDSDTTPWHVAGEVIRCECYSADLVPDSATIKGYEASAFCAIGSRHDFIDYVHTGPAAVSMQILPAIKRTTPAWVEIDTVYGPPIVAGLLTIAIAGFTAGQNLRVRVYVAG